MVRMLFTVALAVALTVCAACGSGATESSPVPRIYTGAANQLVGIQTTEGRISMCVGPFARLHPALTCIIPTACTSLRTLQLTLAMTLAQASDASLTGTATLSGIEQLSTNGACTVSQTQSVPISTSMPVSGTIAALRFNGTQMVTQMLPSETPADFTRTFQFAGSVASGAVTGTLTYREAFTFPSGASSPLDVGSGSTDIPVALH